MTDHESTSFESDETTYSLDDEDQLQPEDTLVDRGTDDALEEGYSPPDRPRPDYGNTATEQEQGETIEQRIRQEVPDPDTAYGAPENESGLDVERVGGDDPDAIDADQDFLGDGEVGDDRAGRLVAEDEGAHEDTEKDMVAQDAGIDGAGASAEEAAVHVVDEEE
ncbi:DUF5709 domain-containing protein [Luteipulveratus sp. YIM 133132]|uniref:DUF5709 domain-containing protein n=1 Tax=Luteipulveratus flavus TaxID=3031728 RepID=UPI0023B117C3|nr:DUF5709 domain-containing protein [Luteipulveratus sp. YIM 133132]MDE9365178.1 DUF5709 domain-containing protein [Luteipulveratus sp. YIM 133132]